MIGLTTIPLIAALMLTISGSDRSTSPTGAENPAASVQQNSVTFTDRIAPLLREKCSPCHYEGGKVFDRYPFDQYDTVRKLGKRLNTRLKGQDAELVTRWIALGFPQGAPPQAKKP
jgi:hypothetical protein